MADNKKQEKDFTKEVDALIPEAESIIKVCQSHLLHPDLSCSLFSTKSGKLQDGLDKLFALEKQTRNVRPKYLIYIECTNNGNRLPILPRRLVW